MKTRDVKVNLQIKTTARLQSLDSVKISAAPDFFLFYTSRDLDFLSSDCLGIRGTSAAYTADKRIKLQGEGLTDRESNANSLKQKLGGCGHPGSII